MHNTGRAAALITRVVCVFSSSSLSFLGALQIAFKLRGMRTAGFFVIAYRSTRAKMDGAANLEPVWLGVVVVIRWMLC